MKRVRIVQLAEGQTYEQSLFLPSGQKLIGPGVTLRANHLAAIYRCGEPELILADRLEELVAAGLLRSGEHQQVQVGEVATRDLISARGQTVVEAGEVIESHHVEALRQGEGHFEASGGGGSGRRELLMLADDLAEDLAARAASMELRVAPGATTWLEPKDPAEAPTLSQWTAMRRNAVDVLQEQYARIEAGLDPLQGVFDSLLDELVTRLSHHPTRFPQIALLCERREDHLADHSYTVAALSMAIAANLRWPRHHVRNLGLAGLLFDLGMMLVPERIRVGGCALSEDDRRRVQRHPMYALSLMRGVPDVPETVRLAALQHHERESGAGYPFGIKSERICDYARVLAVADSYAAITEPRPHRKPRLPYVAMEETLRSAAAQVFWPPAVRALIRAAGLFPVGSYVRLSDDRIARVLACHPDQVDRPLIRVVGDDGPGPSIDLSQLQKDALAVVRPMPAPTPRQPSEPAAAA